jgi:DNA-3-methyladenine glycosylase I
MNRFGYLSKITSLHFLTDIGMPVLKPDRVIRRIFHRLGLLEDAADSERTLMKAVAEGNVFAQATNHPIRYIDLVFVAYGQMKSETSLAQAICLEDKPRCAMCAITESCHYFRKRTI